MSRPLLVALGVVVALAALVALVVQPLLAGDEDAATGLAATTAPGPPVQDAPGEQPLADDPSGDDSQAEPVEPEGAGAPETFEVFVARDPFEQLVVAQDSVEAAGGETTEADETTDGDDPDEAPDDSDSDNSDDPRSDDSDASFDDDEPSASSSERVGATQVELVDTVTTAAGDPAVLVTVNGTGYEVSEGQTFSDDLELLEVSGVCATFRSEEGRFTLCQGETIRK